MDGSADDRRDSNDRRDSRLDHTHSTRGAGGPITRRVDADCDAALEEILADCLASDSGGIGWEYGLRQARRAGGGFVADLLDSHGNHVDTATGRAELVDLAKALLVPMAHQRVADEWRTAADAAGLHDVADRKTACRRFKRGMFAGFLFGMADAVSRGIEGRSLVGA